MLKLCNEDQYSSMYVSLYSAIIGAPNVSVCAWNNAKNRFYLLYFTIDNFDDCSLSAIIVITIKYREFAVKFNMIYVH